MKKLIFSIMLFAFFVSAGFADVITVHNTSPTTGSHACTYTVTFTITAHKVGFPDWHYSTPTRVAIAPNNSNAWTVSPPSGYTLDYSTLNVGALSGCSSNNFGNSSSVQPYNCASCSNINEVTIWDKNSNTDYNIHADLIV